MKKLFYSVALVVVATTASYAQKHVKQNLPVEERAEKAASFLQEKLGLNNEQKQKIKQIELDRIKKMDELRKQDENAMKQKMDERKALAKATKEKINAVLNSEQKKKFETIKEEIKDKIGGMKPPRGPRPDGNMPPPPPTSN